MPICATCGEFTPAGRPHICSGVRLPSLRRGPPAPPPLPPGPVRVAAPALVPPSNVATALTSTARESRGRLEIDITVHFLDGTPIERMMMHTAYNKHLKESYQTNDNYTPQAAPQNTICNLPLRDFKAAFERYARFLIARMKATGTGIQPNTITYADISGVFFTSDCPIMGMDIHCFPCLPPGTASSIVFDLTSQQFGDLIKLLRFSYHQGDRLYRNGVATAGGSDLTSKLGDANNALGRARGTAWFMGLFSPLERQALEARIRYQGAAHNANRAHVGAMLNRRQW